MEIFLDFIKVTILSIVQGFTEFIPVSSTGHMVLVDAFISLAESSRLDSTFASAFMVIIQLGSILAVVAIYWKRLWPFVKDSEERSEKFSLWGKVVVGVIPAAVLGLLFDDLIKELLFNPVTVSIALIFYGVLLILIEKRNRDKTSFPVETIAQLTYKTAFLIGVFQCLAMVPGTSRSAATIIGAMLLGLGRTAAIEYSFFLAIPTMFGATLLTVVKTGISFSAYEWVMVGIGFVLAYVVAYLVINFFLSYIRKHDFTVFGKYRVVVGVIMLLLLFSGVLNSEQEESELVSATPKIELHQ